eukprot:TRINITY_DN7565_c0_g1_i1.p1 TRINITY_DN7565_c0_g1~~TRINITY_DN7565_c0_g1_i1.p1  ORF type:complete len:300 (-),score=33.63 TRINITY_DN7565_c0_g1_i1:20-919(-)
MELSDYEKVRLENIKKNEGILKSLGLQSSSVEVPSPKPLDGKRQTLKRSRKQAEDMPQRKSARLSGQEISSHTTSEDVHEPAPSPRFLKRLPKLDTPEPAAAYLSDPSIRADLPTRDEKQVLRFDGFPHFTPNMTPSEMFQAGSFGGTFFRPFYSRVNKQNYEPDLTEFPDEWFAGIDVDKYLVSPDYDSAVNAYSVKAGQSLEDWENSGWIHPQDPRGWAQWYCRFYMGRRTSDDERQVKRWSGVCGPNGRFKKSLVKKILQNGGEAVLEDVAIAPILRQTLQHWAYRITAEDYRAYL